MRLDAAPSLYLAGEVGEMHGFQRFECSPRRELKKVGEWSEPDPM